MSINNFTVIIRSFDRDNQTNGQTDCWIKLNCPSQFKYISCEVVQFYACVTDEALFTRKLFDLRSDNLNLKNHFDSKNTIAINYLGSKNNSFSKIKFITENFNNQRIHFQLYNELNQLVTLTDASFYNEDWILVLNCEGFN
jgi:hypothetical protein